ncbi:MAG: hypothetical protein CMJ58_20285 [Planctomycetaceae bacterium]|nr:hypothetical protein [Planctomycetaceae bacterium]
MTPLAQRLHAVLSTYATRSRLVLGMIFVLLATIFLLINIPTSGVAEMILFPYLFYCLLWMSAWSNGISDQGRWQFAPARAAILPGYRAPHRMVLMGIYLIPVALVLVTSCMRGQSLPGAHTAVIAFLMTLTIAASTIPSGLILGTFFGYVAFSDYIGIDKIPQLLLDHPHEANVGGILVAIGCALIARRRIRTLSRLTEDDPEYVAPTWSEPGQAARTQQRGALQRTGETSTGPAACRQTIAAFDRWLNRARRWNRSRRILLPTIGEFAVLDAKTLALLMVVGLFLGPLGSFARSHDEPPPGIFPTLLEGVRGLAWFAALIAPPVTAIVAGNGLASRLKTMATERLLPLTRRTYVDSQLVAFAACAVGVWALLNAIAIGVGAFGPPEHGDSVFAASLVTYLGLSFACVIFNFGITAVLTVTSAEFAAIFLITGACGTADLVLLLLWLQGVPDFGWIPACIGALLAGGAGVLFIQHARVLWRERELG